MLGGTGNVMLNASDVAIGGCKGVRGAAVESKESDFGDRAVPLIRRNLFGVDEKIGSPRCDVAGR
jgi:hypothetical protein